MNPSRLTTLLRLPTDILVGMFHMAPRLYSWLILFSVGIPAHILDLCVACCLPQRTYKRASMMDLTAPWLAFYGTIMYFLGGVLWATDNLFENHDFDSVVFLVLFWGSLSCFAHVVVFAVLGLAHHTQWESIFAMGGADDEALAGPFHLTVEQEKENSASISARGARLLLHFFIAVFGLFALALAIYSVLLLQGSALYVTSRYVFAVTARAVGGFIIAGLQLCGALILLLAMFMQYVPSGALALAFGGYWSQVGPIPAVKSAVPKTPAWYNWFARNSGVLAQPAWITGDDGFLEDIASLRVRQNFTTVGTYNVAQMQQYLLERHFLEARHEGFDTWSAHEAHTPRTDLKLLTSTTGTVQDDRAESRFAHIHYVNSVHDPDRYEPLKKHAPAVSTVADFSFHVSAEFADGWLDAWTSRGLAYIFSDGPRELQDIHPIADAQIFVDTSGRLHDGGRRFRTVGEQYWYMSLRFPYSHTPYGFLTEQQMLELGTLRTQLPVAVGPGVMPQYRDFIRTFIPAFMKLQRHKLHVIADRRFRDAETALRTDFRPLLTRICMIPPLAVARAAASRAEGHQGYMKLPDNEHKQSILERYRLVSQTRKRAVLSWRTIIVTLLITVALPIAAVFGPSEINVDLSSIAQVEIAWLIATYANVLIRLFTLLTVAVLELVFCALRLAAIARYTAPMSRGQRTGHFPFGNGHINGASDFRGANRLLPLMQWSTMPQNWGGTDTEKQFTGADVYAPDPRPSHQSVIGATSAPEYAWAGTDHAYSMHEYTTHMLATLDTLLAVTPLVFVAGAALWIFFLFPTTTTLEFFFARIIQAAFAMNTWVVATGIAQRLGAASVKTANFVVAIALAIVFVVEIALPPAHGIVVALITLAAAILTYVLLACVRAQAQRTPVVHLVRNREKFTALREPHFAYGDDAHAMHPIEQLRLEILNSGFNERTSLEGTKAHSVYRVLQWLDALPTQDYQVTTCLQERAWYDLFDAAAMRRDAQERSPVPRWMHWAPLELAPLSFLFVDVIGALTYAVGQLGAPMRWRGEYAVLW